MPLSRQKVADSWGIGAGMGRWGEGSHVPALEKESGQLLLNSRQRAWERTEPSELAGTSIRPSPQPVWGAIEKNGDLGKPHTAFLSVPTQVSLPS